MPIQNELSVQPTFLGPLKVDFEVGDAYVQQENCIPRWVNFEDSFFLLSNSRPSEKRTEYVAESSTIAELRNMQQSQDESYLPGLHLDVQFNFSNDVEDVPISNENVVAEVGVLMEVEQLQGLVTAQNNVIVFEGNLHAVIMKQEYSLQKNWELGPAKHVINNKDKKEVCNGVSRFSCLF